jgi:hypothetical protein
MPTLCGRIVLLVAKGAVFSCHAICSTASIATKADIIIKRLRAVPAIPEAALTTPYVQFFFFSTTTADALSRWQKGEYGIPDEHPAESLWWPQQMFQM